MGDGRIATSAGAPLPPDEKQRLRELRTHDIHRLVSLVDEDRQWFKSRVGLDAEQTPREQAFCAHAILDEEPLVVDDALTDARFADNPLVVADPSIRFYAGAPLVTPSGFRLGTLCVIDVEPRNIDSERLAVLQDLAALASREIELRRMACVDQLTGAFNRGFMVRCGERELALARRNSTTAGLALLDVDNFKDINDTHGHGYGDEVLRTLAAACREASRDSDWFGRLGGDEFALIMPDIDESRALAAAERIRAAVADSTTGADGGGTPVTISIGVTCFPTGDSDDFTAALERADAAMYRAKQQRNQAAQG